MPERRYHIVLNPNAGTALAMGLTVETLKHSFELKGHAATIDPDSEALFPERIKRALASEADVIVAAGGDGTATALASAIVDTAKTLAILPLGTANLLARDLGIPLDLNEAIAAMRDMQPRRIDVAEVNGRIFLNNVVIGFVRGIAAEREQFRGRSDLAAKIWFVRYFFRSLSRARRFAVEIAPGDGEARIVRAQAVAVANNAYDEGFGRFFSRQRLDDGNLSLYVLKHLTLGDLVRLSAGMIVGRWREDEALSIERVRAVTIRAKKSTVLIMIDGEIESLSVPLRFRIRPRALSILAPAAVRV